MIADNAEAFTLGLIFTIYFLLLFVGASNQRFEAAENH